MKFSLGIKSLGLSQVSISIPIDTELLFVKAYTKRILFNLSYTSNSVKMHGYFDRFIEGTVSSFILFVLQHLEKYQ
jgi:hypothetical protein